MLDLATPSAAAIIHQEDLIDADGDIHPTSDDESPERFDQDETFAYIAGYTAAGFAYGVTWGE